MRPPAQVDVLVILNALQGQVQRLSATVHAQQRTLDALAEQPPPSAS